MIKLTRTGTVLFLPQRIHSTQSKKTSQPSQNKCTVATYLDLDDRIFASNSAGFNDSATKSFDDIPCPPGILSLPYIGTGLQFYPFTNFRPNRFDKKVEEWKKQYGNIFKVRLKNQWNVFLCDPNDVEMTFRNDKKYPFRTQLPLFETYNKRRNREPTIGERNGDHWWELRSPAQKGMARSRSLAQLIPKLSGVADDLVATCRVTGTLDNLPYPFFEYASEGAGILCFNTRFGIVTSPGSKSNRQFMTFVDNYFDYFGQQLLAPIHWFKWFRTPGYRKYEKASDFLMSLTDKHTQLAAENLEHTSGNNNEFNLLEYLLKTPNMTSAKLSAILVDFFRGGIDSTANGITFLLYHLAKHPDIQEKLYTELSSHIPTEGPIDNNAFNNLPYLKACLKESFRFVYPVILGTQRVLDKDLILSNYHVPAGTVINLCMSIISKEEKYFPEPSKFAPERWLRTSPDRHKIHPFAHLPFGFGTRNCVGQRFAEQEVYVCVSKIVRNFRVSLPDGLTDVPFVYSTFATPENHFGLKLELR